MKKTTFSRLDWFSVFVSGLLLGISQPVVISYFRERPLDSSGLSGLLVLVAYVPVFLAVKSKTVKQAFCIGFVTALLQHVIILYWFVVAMTVFGDISLIVSLLGLLAVCSLIASYMGCAFALTLFLQNRFAWPFLFVVPFAITSVEYLRNFVVLGGLPWGASAYALADIPVLLQSASLVGIYGLVFWVALINAAIATTFQRNKRNLRQSKIFVAATFLLSMCLLIYGGFRLNDVVSQKNNVRVALLQGNVEQGIRNKVDLYADDILLKYERLQTRALQKPVDLVIWPEASYPYRIRPSDKYIPAFKGLMAPGIIGGVYMEHQRDKFSGKWELRFYNTGLIVDDKFKIVNKVHKNHLVPFGEYVPWPFATIANKVVPGLGVFGRGEFFTPVEIRTKTGQEVKAGITICYEGVFPEISRTFTQNGAKLLVNLTNDAWYGISSAPFQHLNMYKMRAVENGRSYVRATNTGISAVIDSRGRLLEETPLYEEAVLIRDVSLETETTYYVKFGDIVGYLSLVFMLICLAFGLVGKNVFTKKRSLIEWCLALLGLGLVVWSRWYYAPYKEAFDEAAFNKDVFVSGFGFLVGCASLANQVWSRKTLLWLGGCAFVGCTVIACLEGLIYSLGAFIGLSVFMLAWFGPFKRK